MVIDARAFARSAQTMAGRLAGAQCTRLCEGLPDPQTGVFDWELTGRSDAAHAWLDVRAQGMVRVVCQRCLSPFELTLRVSSTLGLVDTASQLEAMDALEAEGRGADVEYLVADAPLDVEALVEDELILALPYAPRHDVCPGAGAGQEDPAGGRVSPFAALAQLKKH
jgi:uncharacterized protein